MSTNTDANEAMHNAAEERYNERRVAVAKALRKLADDFERETKVSDFDRGFRDVVAGGLYTNAASRGMHAISWGFANLHLDSLIENAGAADASAPRPTPEA